LSLSVAEFVRTKEVKTPRTARKRQSTTVGARQPGSHRNLKGRYFENKRNRESVARAVRYYEHAISLDPNYALAWSGLAFTYAASAINSDARPLEVGPRARDAAAQAVRANPRLTEAQFASGYVNWLLDWQWKSAEAALRRAVDLDSSNVTAVRALGHVLSQLGEQSEAEVAMRRTRELDPLSPMSHAMSAQVAYQARDTAAAVKHARQAILIDSTFWIGYMELAQAYTQTGRPISRSRPSRMRRGSPAVKTARRSRSEDIFSQRPVESTKREKRCEDWKQCPSSVTCHRTRWHSSMRASASGKLYSNGWRKRSPRATFT
jgi:Flp pilus assembly protein TadD